MNDETYKIGLETSNKALGPALTKKLHDDFKDVCPDLSRMIVEHVWADIFTRPGLELRTRELAAVSALGAVGIAAPQLRAHLNGALNAGCTPQEIVEVILQLVALAGVPAAMNAMNVAKEVFAERSLHV